eukprot:SAG11_NODE_511_length_8847_cov_3.611911_3_plen_381_part_00
MSAASRQTLELDDVMYQKVSRGVQAIEAQQQKHLRLSLGGRAREEDTVDAAMQSRPNAASEPAPAPEDELLQEIGGVTMGPTKGLLRLYPLELQWTGEGSKSPVKASHPAVHTQQFSIPLSSIEQSATSPVATGGGVFGQHRVEATVRKHDGSSFRVDLQFGSSKTAKKRRNTVMRWMQLSVDQQADYQQALPHPSMAPSEQPAAAASTIRLPSIVEIVASTTIGDRVGSHCAYVLRCTTFAPSGSSTWQVARDIQEFEQLQQQLLALAKVAKAPYPSALRPEGAAESDALVEAFAAVSFPSRRRSAGTKLVGTLSRSSSKEKANALEEAQQVANRLVCHSKPHRHPHMFCCCLFSPVLLLVFPCVFPCWFQQSNRGGAN